MENVLDEGLIITLFVLQPPKQRILADYVASRPVAAGCGGSSCNAMCKNSCANGCYGSCRAKVKKH